MVVLSFFSFCKHKSCSIELSAQSLLVFSYTGQIVIAINIDARTKQWNAKLIETTNDDILCKWIRNCNWSAYKSECGLQHTHTQRQTKKPFLAVRNRQISINCRSFQRLSPRNINYLPNQTIANIHIDLYEQCHIFWHQPIPKQNNKTYLFHPTRTETDFGLFLSLNDLEFFESGKVCLFLSLDYLNFEGKIFVNHFGIGFDSK